MNGELLAAKLKTLKELAESIALHADQVLDKDRGAQQQELYDRLEFRLKNLTQRCKEEEADIKIEIMRELLAMLNKHPSTIHV